MPEVPQYLTLFPISTTALRHLLDGRTPGSRVADRAFMERLLRLEREVEVFNAVATAYRVSRSTVSRCTMERATL